MKNWKCHTDPAIQRHAPRTGQSRADRAYAGTRYSVGARTDWLSVLVVSVLLAGVLALFAFGG
jgi:hypothetical protein